MKVIKTVDAVGHILCHDITQIIKDVKKGVVFHKGHVVKPEDIPVLLSVGKDNLYVWEIEEGMMHENDAAVELGKMCCGENIHTSEKIKEGKIELIASCDGLLLVDSEKLKEINYMGQIAIATRHGNFAVKEGDKLAGARVIPLTIDEKKIERAKKVVGDGKLLNIKKFERTKVGIITTGNEVYHRRIDDTFTPVIEKKLAEFGAYKIAHVVVDDNHEKVTKHINYMIENGADVVLCTGGMSVDPDDKTPLAIKNTGANIVSYGAPLLPGSMFMLAYTNEGVPIMGLPGCVMYAKRTVFDVFLPRILANIKLTNEDLAAVGHGGLCLNCDTCIFPNCGFGKGY